MVTETETKLPEGLPAPSSAGLSPPASPDGGKPEAQAQEPAEGVEGEPTAPPWASVPEVDGLWELEPVKVKLAEREAAAKNTGKEEFRTESLPYLQRQEAHIQSVNLGVGELVEGLEKLNEALPTSGLEEKQYKLLLRQAEPLRQALSGLHQEVGKRIVLEAIVRSSLAKEKAEEFLARIENVFSYGIKDSTFYSDLKEGISKDATATVRAENKELKQKVERLEAEARAAGREGKPAPAKVVGAGGGGGSLTPETYRQKLARGEKVSSEEVDAMSRRYLE